MHHQAIGRLGRGLEVTGRAPDGVVEAVEVGGAAWAFGVQWHPEELVGDGEHARALFFAFAAACAPVTTRAR
jgi:putative glutamine amidotransferase